MAKYLFSVTIACLLSLLLVGSVCCGNEDLHLEETINYATEADMHAYQNVANEQLSMQTTIKPSNWLNEENVEHNNVAIDVSSLKSRNFAKRAPNGFIGMRGKKENDDALSQSPFLSNGNSLEWEIDPLKQAIDDADNANNNNNNNAFDSYYYGKRLKKTPTAFYGVRGKKYSDENFNINRILKSLDEDQFRELIIDDIINRLSSGQAFYQMPDVQKRAPTGFTGVRGKRPANFFDDNNMDINKRGPSSAFVGVRGKKDVDHQHYKRSANGGSSSPLGKKQRFIDFNNKFVAVRGKKSNNEKNAEHDKQKYFLNMLPAIYYQDYLYDKRTPNGFVGMRGKRPNSYQLGDSLEVAE